MIRVRSIADYQFGKGVGEALFPDDVELEFSKKTGRVRYIKLSGKLLATLRPRDGMLALTIEGGRRLLRIVKKPRLRVIASDEACSLIKLGRDVFAKHVVSADEAIRPGEEVLVTDCDDNLLAVGRSVLAGREMIAFKHGIAVKVRAGVGR